MKSAVIIGGGPSGCECSLWLKLFGHESIIVEKTKRLGGLLTQDFTPGDGIEGLRNLSFQEVARNMQADVLANQIPFLVDSTIDLIERIGSGFKVYVGNKVIETHFLVIASGTIASDGGFVRDGNFIIGPGAAFANCDFAGKRVAILGGSDNACMGYISVKERKGAICHVYARTLKA